MTPNVLLLDCPYTLKERLERQGFSVNIGSIGFASSLRQLPSQIYESEVIVYSPTSMARKADGVVIDVGDIRDSTPEYSLSHLKDHILGGAIVLVVVNHLGESIDHNHAYDWIPFMPKLVPTKDQRVRIRRNFEYWHEPYLKMGFLDLNELTAPVRLKLKHRKKLDNGTKDIADSSNHLIETVPLLYNHNEEVLGASFRFGSGFVFVLPSFKSNDDIISTFVNRVVPQIRGVETRRSVIDDFVSPTQEEANSRIDKMTQVRTEAEKRLEKAKEDLVQAKLQKAQTIREDETALLILNYYELAQQQPDVALFFLYKIIEALEKKYGGEAQAKRKLKNNEGWNLIGRISNASYGDVRHAPKPGEKIKQWTGDEIKACFEAAAKIVQTYFATLFRQSEGRSKP